MTHSFKLLKELLSHLSTREIALLKRRIASNQEYDKVRSSKSLFLVNMILNDSEISFIQAGKGIYGIVNRIAFSKLIDRVIDKVDDIFISFSKDVSIFSSERNYFYFSLKKKLLVIQMRLLKGIDYELDWQFEKILTLSRKYEFYEILIDALYTKQRIIVNNRRRKDIEKIEEQIISYEIIRKKVQRARSLWVMIGAMINQANSVRDYENELERAISTTTYDFDQTKSPTIRYFNLFLKLASLHIQEKYSDAEELLQELLKLLNESKSVFTRSRKADVLINLASNQIHTYDFGNAKINAEKAIKLEGVDSSNYLFYSETEFFANFFKGDLNNAEKIIEKICTYSLKRNLKHLLSKRSYLFACIKTLKGEIEKSNELLLQAKELDKNKGSWNIGKRVLTIINCIEAQDHEKAELQVMNLEKFIKRNSKVYPIRKREKLIMRILINLVNEGYDFERVYKNRKRYLDLLESDDPDYAWKIKSPELIIFTEWFKKKMLE